MDAKIAGMMDGTACCQDPRKIFERIMQIQQAKAALYRELSKNAPNECLRQGISNMFEASQCNAKMFAKVADAYGFKAVDPPGKGFAPGLPPYFFAEEKKE